MPTTVKIRRSGTASATPSALEHGEIAINYADGKVFWKNASNVITSFTFQSYALASHTHSISDVTGLQTALDGKASSSHTHAASDITSGTLDIARIANDAVTYAKIQNVSATDRLLGRSSAGAGDVEEITCTSFGRSLIDDADAATARTTLAVQPTASPTFTGTLTAATCSFSGTVTVTSPLVLTGTVAGNVRQLRMQTSGSTRWEVGPGFDAESGSNVGSTFWITRWSDAGAFLGTPFAIDRATGRATFENTVVVPAGSVSSCSVAPFSDLNTGLYFPAANVAAVVTDGVERVRVDASGRVDFKREGTASAALASMFQASLSTNNFNQTYIGRSEANNDCGTLTFTPTTTAANSHFSIGVYGNSYTLNCNGNGRVLIATTTDNGAYALQVNSQIYATNATIATSDARFKTNVESLADATSVIEALRPVAFDFIPQADRNFATERQVGLIAQEAQAALAGTDYADSVVAQCGDHLGLAYEKLVPVLIKALQESNARIAALEERLSHG